MSIGIMRVTTANAAVLSRVAEDVFDHAIGPDRMAAYLDQPNHVLVVAADDNLVVGQARAILHFHPDAAPEIYVDNLGVTPSHRRRGLATRMMDLLVEVGRAAGCDEIWLGTEPDNEEAIGFYAAYGLRQNPMIMFANFEDE